MTASLVNADLLSWTAPDYLTEEQVVVLENGAALPEPTVLDNKCAAYRVWTDVLQPIQSESEKKTLRYMGRYQEGLQVWARLTWSNPCKITLLPMIYTRTFPIL